MSSTDRPTLRWGIIATGWISDKFVRDLILPREQPKANHLLVCVGSSSVEKATTFIDKIWADGPSHIPKPQALGDYTSVYSHPDVDIVYVGTPHALHSQNSLAAIAQGKHVLCEKPMAINEREAREIFAAAEAKGVFIMEAVWTRFFPIVSALKDLLYKEKAIGVVQRMFCDFGLAMPVASLPPSSRLLDPKLGAGVLLDIGLYTLTWASLVMGEFRVGTDHPKVEVTSSMTVVNSIDHQNAVILKYPESNGMAICTSTIHHKSPEQFCRIEGSKGFITISGFAASVPSELHIKTDDAQETKVLKFDREGGMGFFYEADAVALDIIAGRKENTTMPWAETLRMMHTFDSVRRAGGVCYPQDSQEL